MRPNIIISFRLLIIGILALNCNAGFSQYEYESPVLEEDSGGYTAPASVPPVQTPSASVARTAQPAPVPLRPSAGQYNPYGNLGNPPNSATVRQITGRQTNSERLPANTEPVKAQEKKPWWKFSWGKNEEPERTPASSQPQPASRYQPVPANPANAGQVNYSQLPPLESLRPQPQHSEGYVPLTGPGTQPSAPERPSVSSLPSAPELPPMPGYPSSVPEPAVPAAPVAMHAPNVSMNPANAPLSPAVSDGAAWRNQMKAGNLPGSQTFSSYDGARIWAKVGNDVILESDINAGIQKRIALLQREAKKKGTKAPEECELAGEIEKWKMQILQELIQVKVMFDNACGGIPPEAMASIQTSADKMFNEKQVPEMLKEYDVSTQWELERALKAEGSSLERQRRLFFEQSIGAQWLQMQTEPAGEIRYDELMTYYTEHIDTYTITPKARWEEVLVYKKNFPTREAAYNALVKMGQELVSGKPFEQVAKAGSQGFTAAEGGKRDWISPGALKSKPLDSALFTQTVGELSPKIIEDEFCFYIVRVLERNGQRKVPFEEAQKEIRTILATAKQNKNREAAFNKIFKNAVVWTKFDGKPMN